MTYRLKLSDGRVAAITDCLNGPVKVCGNRRCPYHLEHEVFFRVLLGGIVIKRKRAYKQVRSRDTSVDCALWYADQGLHTLQEISAVLGITRERVRQIESDAKIAFLRAGRQSKINLADLIPDGQ